MGRQTINGTGLIVAINVASICVGVWIGYTLRKPPPASTEKNRKSQQPPPTDRDPPDNEEDSGAAETSGRVHRVVLTGGPCGGKTTALAKMSAFLHSTGHECATVPEAFTLLMSHGIGLHMLGRKGMDVVVQRSVMDLQEALEESFARVLDAWSAGGEDGVGGGASGVLLCDRGMMDGAAYLPAREWRGLLENRGSQTNVDLREKRYDAVLHLVTAAEGAERHYSTDNNDVRTETPERAREMDALTRRAWLGHPRHLVFDNENTDFQGKMQSVQRALAGIIGQEEDDAPLLNRTVKYLVRSKGRGVGDKQGHDKNSRRSSLYFDALEEEEEEEPDILAIRRRSCLGRSGSFINLDEVLNSDDEDVRKNDEDSGLKREKNSEDHGKGENDDAVSKLIRYGIQLNKFPEDLRYKIYEVEKVYLYDGSVDSRASDGYVEEYSFVRRRSYGSSSGVSYGQTTVKISKSGEETEVKRIISSREYASTQKVRDLTRHIVKQVRVNFIWEMVTYTLTLYTAPVDDVCVLYYQSAGGKEVILPPFLDIERRLNADDKEAYGSHSISLVKKGI
eukprot:CAMPEP_0194295902 /NCGR_PEP_ID=MMETSP0169-20130528/54666_1 /TAXON_ID=218684 /ORGANISM="Corethron pennatum, Strain L29A3" /LENGTH=563 /DNA_ID=CAMNT_0039045195 /DNA_START=175 /DNA_END=1866 /DNA_ORIENTATION=-